MDKPKPNIGFKLMSLVFGIRDFFSPRMNVLKEVGIKEGFCVLDYGCGPGGCINPLAELVGKSGKVYALDIHSLAAQAVQTIASKKRLTNVEAICSNCKTGLLADSIDVALLYDTFHALSAPQEVLEELHRILKPNGILSVSDHHMTEDEIVSGITNAGLFSLSRKGERTHTFLK